MTTAIYKDGILAVDSLTSQGYSMFDTRNKLMESKEFYATFTGDYSSAMKIVDNIVRTRNLSLLGLESVGGDCEVIVLEKLTGDLYIIESNVLFALKLDKNQIYSFGSGGNIAHGAALMGADAMKAVECACAVDLYSKLPVNCSSPLKLGG